MEPWEVRLTKWALWDAGDVLPWLLGGIIVIVLGAMAYLWFLWWAQVLAAGGIVAYALANLKRRLGLRRRHSDLYTTHLSSAAWQITRKRTIRRAGFRCARCKARGPLDVHHLTYERLGHERPEDVIALCRSCHRREHAKRGAPRWKR